MLIGLCSCADLEATQETEGQHSVGSIEQALPENAALRGLGNKCVDVQWGSAEPGTAVHMWPCHGGPAQHWTYTNRSQLVGLGGLCLDVQWANTSPGTPVHMWPCNGGAAQRWTFDSNGSIRGLGGLCLDVRWADRAPGTPLHMWPCSGELAQLFSLSATSRGDGLRPGEVLLTGDSISAQSFTREHYFQLYMQADCNLVLYRDGQATWASDTAGAGSACYATMQRDGNLVLYNGDHAPLWASDTAGHPDAHLSLQGDGNLVVYLGGQPLWASDTYELSPPPLPPGGF